MESDATKNTAPAETPSNSAALGAWQPFSFGGVAAFARASFGRLFIAQFVTAAAVAACIVWLLARQWCPVIETAIAQLPAERAVIHEGQLVWPAREASTLAETHFLAIVVSPHELDDTGLTADLQFELGKNHLRVGSLFGYLAWPYPEDRQLPLTRGEAEPWWGAWKPILLAGVAGGTVVCLLFVWAVFASCGMFVVRLIAFFTDRECTRNGHWQLAAAALLPGAWIFAMGVVLYGLEWLPLLGLLLVTAVHLVVGWVYLFFAPFCLPRVPEQFPAVANPFTTTSVTADGTAAPVQNPFTGDETLVKPPAVNPPSSLPTPTPRPSPAPTVPVTIPTTPATVIPAATTPALPTSSNPFSTPDAPASNPFANTDASTTRPPENPFIGGAKH